jgi:hypothetical protein
MLLVLLKRNCPILRRANKRRQLMSKYEPLWKYLQANGGSSLRLTYDEIHATLGFDVDHSLLTYKKEAAMYGYELGKISLKEKYIIFNKCAIKRLSQNT